MAILSKIGRAVLQDAEDESFENLEAAASVYNQLAIDERKGILSISHGLTYLGEAYENRFSSSIADDSVLGPAWLDILQGLRTLLNGETGDIDCGKVDGNLVEIAKMAGFDPDSL